MLNFTLSDELAALKRTTARFASREIAPFAQSWESQGLYPDDFIRKLARQGFMGILVPEAYGGAGGTHMSFAVILEELARHDGGTALSVEAHNGLCLAHMLLAASERQKRRFLPRLVNGECIGSWCLSEPHCGTDASALRTTAKWDDGSWILNGSKQFITNGHRAGLFVIMAKTDPDKGARGISAFIVERDRPGLATGRPEKKLGMCSSDTVCVSMDHVRIPGDHLLGVRHAGFEDVKKVLERGRIMIAAVSLGLARGAMEESVRYAHQRKAFGKPLIAHQAIQLKIADMATHIEAGRLLIHKAATLQDQGGSTPLESATAKLFNSEMATRVCMDAIQIFGGYGYLKEYQVERYMRDAKLCEIGEGTSEINRILAAREISRQFGFEAPRP